MSDGNLKVQKIQKSSRIALKAARAVKVILIVAAVLALSTGAMMIAFQDPINREVEKAVSRGDFTREEIMPRLEDSAGFEMHLVAHLTRDGYFSEVLGTYLFTIGIMLGLFAVVMHFIGKVFQEIQVSYSPFQPGIVKSVKVAFIMITLFSLESNLLIGITVGFSLWSVVNIFEYGCELQKQSDETL